MFDWDFLDVSPTLSTPRKSVKKEELADPNSCKKQRPGESIAYFRNICRFQVPGHEQESWLGSRRLPSGTQVFGCTACAHAKTSSGVDAKMARFEVTTLRRCNLEKHAKGRSHLQNEFSYCGQSPDSEDILAPASSEFRKVWKLRQAGMAFGEDESVGRAKKLRAMTWCLAEAKRNEFRKFLRNAACSTLVQDGRKNRLFVRIKTCDSSLQIRHGNVGLVRGTGGGHKRLAEKTVGALIDFCTPGLGAPSMGTGNKVPPRPDCDAHLLERLTNSIKFYFSDAASDEQLAGHALMEEAGDDALLPSLKLVGRDKTHASRRVLTRPWRADTYLSDCYDTVLMNKDSIISIIRNSDEIADWFAAAVQECELGIGGKIRSMSFKRHRFDSQSKPLARFVLFFDAVLSIACTVHHHRGNTKPGIAATKFMRWAAY